MAEIKELQFVEGTMVTAPTLVKALAAQATGSSQNEVVTLAYLTANGSGLKNNVTTTDPTTGDDSADGYAVGSQWFNSTSGVHFIASSVALGAAVWRAFDMLAANQTISGTKTISSILSISNTTQSTNKDTGCLVLEGGLGVEKDVFIGGSLTIANDLTVSGTLTTINTVDLDVKDKNITINKGGNDAASVGAGLLVDRTSTKGSLLYDSTLASRFKVGDLASESEVLSAGTTQTVSGAKTFSAAVNISNTTQSTDKDTGALIIEGGVGVEKNLNVGGDVGITGNLTVSGTTTTINTTNLDVKDNNITINKNGNDAASVGAGILVDRTSTKGSLLYDSTLTSRFKLGDLASESEVMTVGTAQSVSGTKTNTVIQTYDAAVMLKSIATPSTPAATYYKFYPKSDGFLYYLNPSGTETQINSTSHLALRYANAASTSVANNTLTLLPFATSVYDTGSSWNTGTSTFTAPFTRKFAVYFQVRFIANSWANKFIELQATKNGAVTNVITFRQTYNITSSLQVAHHCYGEVDLVASDTLTLRVLHDNGAGNTLDGSTSYNYMSISSLPV